jgi:pimeloyl-ACP methyl ester carboxylesterase
VAAPDVNVRGAEADQQRREKRKQAGQRYRHPARQVKGDDYASCRARCPSTFTRKSRPLTAPATSGTPTSRPARGCRTGVTARRSAKGFSDGGGQLARRIDQDYPDLNLVDNLVLTGADGSIAYEGRVSAMPRDLSDTHSIGVTTAGWMAHAKDRMFQEIYVDRDVGQWGDMPLERKARTSASRTQYRRLLLRGRAGRQRLRAAEPGARRADRRGGVVSGAARLQGRHDRLPREGHELPRRLGAGSSPAQPTARAATLVGTTLDDTLRTATITTPTRYVGHRSTATAPQRPPPPARASSSRSSPSTATTASRRTPATRSSRTACTCPTS